METPNNQAGTLTEGIMRRIASRYNPDAVLKDIDTATYNKLYSAVYAELEGAPDERAAAVAYLNKVATRAALMKAQEVSVALFRMAEQIEKGEHVTN
jgi:hypothetical protein